MKKIDIKDEWNKQYKMLEWIALVNFRILVKKWNGEKVPQKFTCLKFRSYLIRPTINDKNIQRETINRGESMSFLYVKSNISQ